MCYVFNEFAYTERKKDETTLAGAVFLFHFFSLPSTPSTRTAASLSISVSLSISLNDHYKKKKIVRTHLSHPRTLLQENGHFYFIIIMYIFFFIPRTPATIAAIIQMPLLHFCSQCAFVRPRALFYFGHHFAGAAPTLYRINIICIL